MGRLWQSIDKCGLRWCGLAALAAEQVVKAGKVLAEKGEIYVEQGKRYGEELQQKLQEDAQRRREEQLEQRISAMDAQEREALRRRLAELDELELLDAAGVSCAGAFPEGTELVPPKGIRTTGGRD